MFTIKEVPFAIDPPERSVFATRAYYSTIEVVGPKRVYGPVGKCIYCGATGVRLNDEHIFPLSLGGNWVLPASSCNPCSNITGKYEQECARHFFWPIRARLKFPTRRKKDVPTDFSMQVNMSDGSTEKIKIDRDLYPATLFLYLFDNCRIVTGAPELPEGQGEKMNYLEYMSGPPDSYVLTLLKPVFDALEALSGKKVVSLNTNLIRPFSFAQMIAKISHAYAVAELGIGAFTPLLTYFIRDRSEIIGRYIGGSYERAPAIESSLHWISLSATKVNDRWYLRADLHMFSLLGGGYYHAIVGEFFQNCDNYSLINQIVSKSGSIDVILKPSRQMPRWAR